MAGGHAIVPFANVPDDERAYVAFPDPVEVMRKLRVYNAFCAQEDKRRAQFEKFRFA